MKLRILQISTSIALLIILCVGCTLSYNPLFTEKDVIFDPALAGIWQDTNHNAQFNFRVLPGTGTKNYYLQTDMKDQPQGKFVSQLGMVGKYRFLQIVPQRPDNIHARSFYGAHFIQLFSFWKVTLDSDKLKLTPLNYEWIEAMAKQNKLDIKHEQREGEMIILTASTPDLQAFVLKYADNTNAFGDGLEFTKAAGK